MIQLLVTITEGKEPDGKPSIATQQAIIQIHPATKLEQLASKGLSDAFTKAMYEWHAYWRREGMIESFTAIERKDPPPDDDTATE